MGEEITAAPAYTELLGRISEAFVAGQTRATQAVNAHITETYWQIGRDIVEFEQGGKARAEYGKNLLKNLSRDLTLRHGRGFSRSNVIRIRQFYMAYPKGAKPSHLLSWSHFVELLKLDDPLERSFYEQQAIHDKWSVPELQRQMKSSLFLRLAAGKDKDAILQLAQQGQLVSQASDLLRDPFVFEFLKIPEPHSVSETDLETRLCDHLSRDKNELLVEYATYQMNSQLFVQKYQLYLPNREELRRELELTLQEAVENGGKPS